MITVRETVYSEKVGRFALEEANRYAEMYREWGYQNVDVEIMRNTSRYSPEYPASKYPMLFRITASTAE